MSLQACAITTVRATAVPIEIYAAAEPTISGGFSNGYLTAGRIAAAIWDLLDGEVDLYKTHEQGLKNKGKLLCAILPCLLFIFLLNIFN